MTKSNIEYEQIKMELEAVKKRDMMLRDRVAKLSKHESDADAITVDERLTHLKDDVDPAAVNYILGQSAGYVDGIRAAIGLIVEAMASEYRDIPMTEDELNLLIELGEAKERAWLKDYKQRQITEKSEWKFEFGLRCPVWVRKEQKEQKEQNMDYVYIVTYYDKDAREPVVTAFDNRDAAEACYETFKQEHDITAIDHVKVYKEFKILDNDEGRG